MTFSRLRVVLRVVVYLRCILCHVQISHARCSGSANHAAGSGSGVHGRHSYSLSTFSPAGDLDQVVRAMRASVLGVPIVALSIPAVEPVTAPSSKVIATTKESPLSQREGGIYLSIPLRFLSTSPLLLDDGTPRIVQLTSSLCVAHTGVGADGRALCDVATKMALDYRYIFGEEITVEELLEGLSDKVQEMTMKAGSRPYGCALLVGCLGSDDIGRNGRQTCMYRVDPSGAIVLLSGDSIPDTDENSLSEAEDIHQKRSVAFLGNWGSLRRKQDTLRAQLEAQQFANEEELRSILVGVAQQSYTDESSSKKVTQPKRDAMSRPILFASFTRERGLEITRITNRT